MNKIKESITNNLIFYKVTALAFFAQYLIYGIFLNDSYISDNIGSEAAWTCAPPPASLAYYFGQGRGMTFFHDLLLYNMSAKLGYNRLHNVWPITLMMYIFMAFAVGIFYVTLSKYFKKREGINWFLFIILLVGIINPFFTEFYGYYAIETASALWCVAISISYFARKKYIPCFIWLFVSECTYQNMFEAFFIWALIIVMLESDFHFNLRSFKNYVNVGILAVLSLVGNLLGTKIAIWATYGFDYDMLERYSTATPVKLYTATAAMGVVIESKKMWLFGFSVESLIRNLINALGAVFKNVEYPSGWFLIMAIIACGLILVILLKNKHTIGDVLGNALVLLGMNLTFLAIYFTGTADYSGRLLWPFFVSAAGSCLLLYRLLEDSTTPRYILAGVVAISCLVLVYFTESYSADYYMRMAIDSQVIGTIHSEIEEYEAESGNEITKISVYHSPDMEYTSKYLINDYPFRSYSYNSKTYYRSWADVNLINVLYDENYERLVATEDEAKKYFGEAEWTEFNPSQQLVFEGDTLYWAKY